LSPFQPDPSQAAGLGRDPGLLSQSSQVAQSEPSYWHATLSQAPKPAAQSTPFSSDRSRGPGAGPPRGFTSGPPEGEPSSASQRMHMPTTSSEDLASGGLDISGDELQTTEGQGDAQTTEAQTQEGNGKGKADDEMDVD